MITLDQSNILSTMHGIMGIASDSRLVQEGYLFAAVLGNRKDGFDCVGQAIENGASFILCDANKKDKIAENQKCQYILSNNVRRDLAILASKFYSPAPKNIAMVTGTHGKTSTCSIFQKIMLDSKVDAVNIGTLGVQYPDAEKQKILNDTAFAEEGSLTTTGPISLARILNRTALLGIEAAVLEASSHGLDQYRVDGVNPLVAGFTSLGRDHLDYHKTHDEYANAKYRLFSEVLSSDGTAVYNFGCKESYSKIRNICQKRGIKSIIFNSSDACGDLFLNDFQYLNDGFQAKISVMGRMFDLHIKMFGRFQVNNVLCAIGMALANDIPINKIISAVENLKPIKGRMEPIIKHKSGGVVMVDFAHAPLALSNALKNAREHCKGNLHIVFGCGGNRDKGKRKIMGEIAGKLADKIIVTDDNPRYENAGQIRAEILTGIEVAEKAAEKADRDEAIKFAFKNMNDNDFLLVAGKGHEENQIIEDKKINFSDKKEILSLLPADGWSNVA